MTATSITPTTLSAEGAADRTPGTRREVAGASELKFGTILVPIDFSPPSRVAYEYALGLADKFGSRVSLLHVLEKKPDQVLPPEKKTGGRAAAGARDELIGFAKNGLYAFVPVSPEVRRGEPWKEIVAAAQKERADLIVISTHGRTALQHVLMGSVAEKVVRQAPCPVLVIREGRPDLLVTRKEAKL